MSSEGADAMNEENSEKSALVPRLRFPEFRATAEWKQKTLADVCLQITNGKANAEDHEDGGIYPLYDRSEVVKQSSEFVFDDEVVIIPGEGMRFQPKYYKGKFNLHQRAYALMLHQGNARFVYYTMDRFKDTLAKNAVKSTVLSLRLPIIERFGLAIPSTAEQQKIADCLSSLDELITAETQKLDALKTHKKGLMQQLFPRQGETVPQLRFPEFRQAGEWEQVTLGEIAEVKLGKMLDSKKHTTGNLLPYLNNLAVRWNEVDTSNLPKMYFDDDELDRFGLKTGDVVVCEGGEPGRSAVWDGRLPDIKFQKAIHRIRFKVPFEPRLLVLFLESIAGTPRLESLLTGGGIKHLTQEVFARLKIPFTTNAEQQRISGCLASLDDLITAQAKKIDVLRNQKQGLMQQLFPVLDEVRE